MPDLIDVDTVVIYVLDLLEVLLDLDDDQQLDDATITDLFDIMFGVNIMTTSEECLHLAVSTPYDPTEGTVAISTRSNLVILYIPP